MFFARNLLFCVLLVVGLGLIERKPKAAAVGDQKGDGSGKGGVQRELVGMNVLAWLPAWGQVQGSD